MGRLAAVRPRPTDLAQWSNRYTRCRTSHERPGTPKDYSAAEHAWPIVHQASHRLFLIEYDRPRRVDKSYDKLRRYNTFLCWWWRHTPLVDSDQPPFVLFICQDESQRAQFLSAADREPTGHRWHPTAPPVQHEYVGRRRILFAIERDAHDGVLEAWRLPAHPPGHPARNYEVRRVAIAPPRSETSTNPHRLQPAATSEKAQR